MGCSCGGSKKEKLLMSNLVNFENSMVKRNSLPHGAVRVSGVWYYDFNNIPDDVWEQHAEILKKAYPERAALRTVKTIKKEEVKTEQETPVQTTESTLNKKAELNVKTQTKEEKPAVSNKASDTVTTETNNTGDTTPKIGG